MQGRVQILSLLILFPYFSFAQKHLKSITLDYIGSSTVGNFIQEADAHLDTYSFQVNTRPESAGGEQAILEGRTDIAGIARLPSQKILSSGVRTTLIGWDAIAIIVHPSNPITNLTQDQLKRIYTGQITNWNQLGGADLPIKVFIVGEESATRKVCRSIILGKADYKRYEEVRPDIDIIDKVRHTPGAIGQLSYSFLEGDKTVKPLRINGQSLTLDNINYPITRPLYLLWWQGRSDVESFAQWARSKEGQSLVMQHFIGVRNASVQFDQEEGALIVYTNTVPLEDGGIYYYPHQSYDILTSDHQLLMTVPNHLSNNDETPTRKTLSPGQYIIRVKSHNGNIKYFPVTITPNKLTRLYPEINQHKGGEHPTSSAPPITPSLQKSAFNFFGDFRVRGEDDLRQEFSRFRGRFRIRAGMFTRYNDRLRLEMRLVSTGDPHDPNSTHVNLSKGFDQIKVAFDRAFVRYDSKRFPGLTAWLGKFANPNTSSNIYSEVLWDADIQPEGVALAFSRALRPLSSRFRWTNGMYLLSQFKTGTRKNWLYTTQFTLHSNAWNDIALTLSSGAYYYNKIKGLDVRSGIIDYNEGNKVFAKYTVVNGDSTQTLHYLSNFFILNHFILFQLPSFGRPIAFKLQNLFNVGASHDNKGYIAGVSYGHLKDKGDWRLYYQYGWVEQEAVFTPFAQDDALAKSAVESHILGIAKNLHRKVSLHLWTLIDRPLRGVNHHWDTRVRIDLNVKF